MWQRTTCSGAGNVWEQTGTFNIFPYPDDIGSIFSLNDDIFLELQNLSTANKTKILTFTAREPKI